MNSVAATVRSYIKRKNMLEGSSGVVVAVSGGPDSVALLHILVKIAEVEAKRRSAGASHSPPALHVAHLDHMLRGSESAADAEFVRALARELGLNATISALNIRAEAGSRKRGIEETAREARYRFLLDTATKVRADRIAVGHTLDDQAETVLLRIIRGTGTTGLAAMRPVRSALRFDEDVSDSPRVPESVPSPVILIRPLMCLSRDEVEQYCRENDLKYRSDATNLLEDYTRNRVRRRVIPELLSINPKVREALARFSENAAADDDALRELTADALDDAHISGRTGRRAAYSATILYWQTPGLRRRIVMEALRRFAVTRVDAKAVRAIVRLIERRDSGKRVEMGNGLVVWRELDLLIFERGQQFLPYEISLTTQTEVEAGGCRFEFLRQAGQEDLQSAFDNADTESADGPPNWMSAVLEGSLLPDRLLIRPRLPGERVVVLGRSTPKKLKKLMIDHRIPTSRRATWPVVITPDGQYVWSPGLPPAARFAGSVSSPRPAILRAWQV